MPGTAGLYFRGLNQAQTNTLRARLNDLAGDLGYIARSGPTTGDNRGVLAHYLVGLDKGEVAAVKLSDAQREFAITYLCTMDNEWAEVIAAALWAAVVREAEADERTEVE